MSLPFNTLLTMAIFACYMPHIASTCGCRLIKDSYKLCLSEFAIDARIQNKKLDTSDVTIYNINIIKVLKGDVKRGQSTELRIPKNCRIGLQIRDVYFITGEYDYRNLDGKGGRSLKTTRCEIVENYQSDSGRYNTDSTFNAMLKKWYKQPPDCEVVRLEYEMEKNRRKKGV